MKAFRILALTLFIASPCFPQEKPEAPKPNRRIFIAGVSLLAASKGADVSTTRDLLNRGGWETNTQLGKHPSDARLVGHAAAMFGIETTSFYFTERNRHALIRWAGRAYLGLIIEEHARLATCNAEINVHSSISHSCHSFVPF